MEHDYEMYRDDEAYRLPWGWHCWTCKEDSLARFRSLHEAEEAAQRFHDADVVKPDPRVLTEQEQSDELALAHYDFEERE